MTMNEGTVLPDDEKFAFGDPPALKNYKVEIRGVGAVSVYELTPAETEGRISVRNLHPPEIQGLAAKLLLVGVEREAAQAARERYDVQKAENDESAQSLKRAKDREDALYEEWRAARRAFDAKLEESLMGV